MAPSETPTTVHCRTVGAAAAVTSGKATPKTETRPGTVGRHAERQHAAAGTMPRQRRGEESSQGVCQRLLCRTSFTGRGARGVQYIVEEPSGDAATPAPGGGAVLFTPPQQCAVARRPETRPRLPRLWLCTVPNHRQCSTCAAVGRVVRHCCARRHTGHPPLPEPSGAPGRARAAGLRTPGGGDPLSLAAQASPTGAGKLKLGLQERTGAPRPPPPRSGREWSCMTRPGMGAQGRRSHNPTPPEILTQARPPAATPVGVKQDGLRNVPCTDFGGASGDHGGPGPMRVSLFNIVSPLPPNHTHTQEIFMGLGLITMMCVIHARICT